MTAHLGGGPSAAHSGGQLLPPSKLWKGRLVRSTSSDVFHAGVLGREGLPSGLIRYRGNMYAEVSRKSVHGVVLGFGRETDQTGFYHFFGVSPTGIFLRVGLPVMDYTCPPWVLRARRATLLHVPPTSRRWRFTRSNRSGATAFVHSFAIRCVDGWCTPSACEDTTFEDTWEPSISMPAYWKSDPPLHEHDLRQLGFNTSIVFWAGHQPVPYRKAGTSGPKVLVDMRKYGVTDASYRHPAPRGGVRMIACPGGPHSHHYFVARDRQLRACECEPDQYFLSCSQLNAWERIADDGAPDTAARRAVTGRQQSTTTATGAARVVGHFANGSVCADLRVCISDVAKPGHGVPSAINAVMREGCAHAEVWPPANDSSCRADCAYYWDSSGRIQVIPSSCFRGIVPYQPDQLWERNAIGPPQ